MASNNTYSHSINLRYILESQKLSRKNFLDWEKNLRIVLDCERKLYILDIDPPKSPAANACASELTSFKKYEDDARDVKCIIMASMTVELQRLHADMEARSMIQRLRDLFQGHPKNSGIYVIEVNMSGFTSWVMDTGCGSHICTSMQNLHEVRHLAEGEVQLKAPFTGHGERVSDVLGLIHSDVCGPINTEARGGFSYFVTFTDDLSRYGYVYHMKHKSECFDKFKEFRNEVEKQLGKSIKTLRSDRGGEYLSLEFNDYLKEHGILSQLTPPGTPQLNGVSERRNRTLLDMVRSMMSLTTLPESFWGKALLTAAHTLNRVPSKVVESTPYELWRGTKPNLSYLRIWGCDVYVRRLMMFGKLDSKSDRCKFVGYPKETKAYEFYHPADNKIFVARNGTFLEK
ncbi:unnamed protein product [Cuscuta campestris]|uniref:Integrase catalytic domain-containing protein n=1 Tax=Cuscuta campestris TaxID=132261 RepID=A0A484M2Z6_9ASTE|nr:unnamed protein product [Cuscuta campestris]